MCSIVGVGLAGTTAEAGRPTEELLPKTTAGFVAVTSMEQLGDHWDRTQVGQLMADPVMKPFTDSLKEQFEDRWSGIHERFGLTWDDLREVPTGEVCIAAIRPRPNEAATAVVADVTGNLDKTKEMLARVSASLAKQGAEKTERVVGETTIIFFDVPPPKHDPEAKPQKTFYFLSEKDNLLAATDSLEVIQGILERLSADPGDSLANLPGFRAVMDRCAKDAGDVTPQLRWFIHPLAYAEAVRTRIPQEKRRREKSFVDVMQNQGVDAVRGMGGYVDFAVGGYEVLHRTVIDAPPPYRQSMKMAAFPNGGEYAPQRWVPRDVAMYTSFYCDLLNGFDNFGPLIDEVFGKPLFLFRADVKCQQDLDSGVVPQEFHDEFKKEKISLEKAAKVVVKKAGTLWDIRETEQNYIVKKVRDALNVYEQQTGVWKDVLEGLKTDEEGPQIDLRCDLFEHLGQRVTMISDYQLPITPTSERLLSAVETTDEKATAAAIEKWFKVDWTAKRREIDGHVIWEIVEETETAVPKISVGAIPSLGPKEGEDDAEEDRPRMFPHMAVTVAHGHLFVSSHLDFLLKVLKPAGPRETLNLSIDYRLVAATIQKLEITEKCAEFFRRTDEVYRPTYELIRQGKMPVSETLVGRTLNSILGEGEDGTPRSQKIDGSTLPDYDVVRRYLGPAGMVITSEPQGWFFKGFMLTKESQ
ncbi:MAG: hypothetical protein A2V70_00175 [Planctomycetes bacterium RBG_13_63_9]|nr:MAG: hypothetical protein A2V70_00175 [Planctomycetes bacterium RBG_13_63_9]